MVVLSPISQVLAHLEKSVNSWTIVLLPSAEGAERGHDCTGCQQQC